MRRFKASFKVVVLAILWAVLVGMPLAGCSPGLSTIDGAQVVNSAAKQKVRRADRRSNADADVEVDVDRRGPDRRDVDVDVDVDRSRPGR